jgi:hypothetical protein
MGTLSDRITGITAYNVTKGKDIPVTSRGGP